MNSKNIFKKAFSLLELIFVIVISSLLGMVMMSFPDNDLAIARDQLMKDIRYTQYLALFDDKFLDRNRSGSYQDINRSKFWFKSFWQLKISRQGSDRNPYYSIFSDTSSNSRTTNFDRNPNNNKDEPAIDPLTRKYLTGIWKELFSSPSHYLKKEDVTTRLNLGLEYGIEKIESNTTLGGKWTQSRGIRFMFDSLGRPFYYYEKEDLGSLHPFNFILKETIQIKLSKDDDKVCFNLEPISGYTYITSCIF